MKRRIACLLLILLLAAGCTGTPRPTQTAPRETSAPTVTPEPSAAPEPSEAPAPQGNGGPDALGELFTGADLADLDGNDVSLGGLVSANKLTLINIWGTFCGPCIREMPDLGDLAREYAGEGFGIVGLACDILDGSGRIQPQTVQDARDILESTGAEYPVLILSLELMEATELMYVPTSYFLDASGSVLEGPLVGSMSREDWKAEIERLLAEAG